MHKSLQLAIRKMNCSMLLQPHLMTDEDLRNQLAQVKIIAFGVSISLSSNKFSFSFVEISIRNFRYIQS